MEVKLQTTTPHMLPVGWQQDTVDRLASITTGAKNTQDKIDDGKYPFFVRSPVVERINSYSFDGEAVLTAGDGVGTGKVFHYINGKFDYHQRVYKISDFCTDLDGYYFYLYFSTYFYERIMSMTAKSSVDSVRREMIADMVVPLPPITEQRAIAATVKDTDDLIAGLERLIAKKRGVKQAAMQQLLTGKTRLPGFVGEWENSLFGDMVLPRSERVDPRRSGTHDFCIELDNIEQGTGRLLCHTDTNQQSSLKAIFYERDVLFGKLRAYLRKYWLAKQNGVCSTEIWVLTAKPNRLIPEYLYHLVTDDRFIDAASTAYGTHMPRSDWNVVKSLELAVPSLPEQCAIAAVLSDMDAEIAALERQREKTRMLKQGMMQELLTGRTRLV